jgi:hypothetical protein
MLVITGSMGTGKTTIMGEASDVLLTHGVVHAAIDGDALGCGHFPPGVSAFDLLCRNLQAVCQNCIEAGITTFVVAQVIESREELNSLQSALPHVAIIVCRLRASITTMQQRLRVREPGMFQQTFLERAVALDAMLDAAAVEHFVVTNDEKTHVTDAATDLLGWAGWIQSTLG